MYVFFFKQKTADEMRISDWSSDVCSSDLGSVQPAGSQADHVSRRSRARYRIRLLVAAARSNRARYGLALPDGCASPDQTTTFAEDGRSPQQGRSEDSRGGTESDRTCRSR